MRELPHEICTFELRAFFTFGPAERELIAVRRGKQPIHPLQLAYRQFSIQLARHRNRVALTICTKTRFPAI